MQVTLSSSLLLLHLLLRTLLLPISSFSSLLVSPLLPNFLPPASFSIPFSLVITFANPRVLTSHLTNRAFPAWPYIKAGLVFDYYVDDKCQMVLWDDKVEGFGYNSSEAYSNIFVPSVESTRLAYFLNSFIVNKHYCMFVGNAGTGKTALMRDNLKNLDPEVWWCRLSL